MVNVVICIGFAERQLLLEQTVPPGTCLAEALGLAYAKLEAFDPSWPNYATAIFGKVAEPTQVLKEGDQIELLRPLIADPNLARQRRVEAKRKQVGRNAWRRNSRKLDGKIDQQG